jgi:oxalate decarboxylase/phosphoglucose isomerase-like protein (cupin superfamily)
MDSHSSMMSRRVISGSSLRKTDSSSRAAAEARLTLETNSGIPHSIQALEGGAEFMLVFDQGDFSEDNTFLATQIFAHNPVRRFFAPSKNPLTHHPAILLSTTSLTHPTTPQRSVLSKDLGVPVSAFQNASPSQLFIFPGTKAPSDITQQNVTGSAGPVPQNATYSFHWSEQKPFIAPGGTVKIVDPQTFPIAPNFSAALVTIKPGCMREIHWHPLSDEWSFFISGAARATLFTPPSTATTFDYRAGDVAYFPKSNSHYVENVGEEDVVFLEVLQADHFQDVSLGQWVSF